MKIHKTMIEAAAVGKFDLAEAGRAATFAAKPVILKLLAGRGDDLDALDEAAAAAAPLIVANLGAAIEAHDVSRRPLHVRRAWGPAKLKLKAGMKNLSAELARTVAEIFADEKRLALSETQQFAAEVEDAFA